jgi:hypothetical protein
VAHKRIAQGCRRRKGDLRSWLQGECDAERRVAKCSSGRDIWARLTVPRAVRTGRRRECEDGSSEREDVRRRDFVEMEDDTRAQTSLVLYEAQ